MTPPRTRKLAHPVRYISRETATKLTQMRDDYQQGDEEAMAVARSGWDMVNAFAKWVRSIARWLALGLFVIIAYYFFGWVFAGATLLGVPAAWVIGNIYLHGRYEIVDSYDDDTLKWDTWQVGVEKFKGMHHTGVISPVSSSKGTIRYLAKKFDPEAATMESAWVTELSSFQYLVDMKTHGRLRDQYEGDLDRFLDAIGYSSVTGKILAAEHVQAFITKYDEILSNLDAAYLRRPTVTHELIETPTPVKTEEEELQTTTISEAARKAMVGR